MEDCLGFVESLPVTLVNRCFFVCFFGQRGTVALKLDFTHDKYLSVNRIALYNVGEKPTVILYTYINRHAEPLSITKHKN